jgi:hypothetical protein
MRITVITSTLNCSDALRTTASSIRAQTYRDVQWIVADGASTDGTVQVIHDNSDIIGKWFSEPDSGVYDAWNKASAFIDGEWVLFLGAGDRLLSPGTVHACVGKLKQLPPDVVIGYGDVLSFRGGRLVYRHGAVTLGALHCYKPATPCHQGVFQRADCFRRPQPFDQKYKVVADTKFMLESLKGRSMAHIGEEVSEMTTWGLSAHPTNAVKVMREFLRLERELGYSLPVLGKIYYIASATLKSLMYRSLGGGAVHALVAVKQWLTNAAPKRRAYAPHG